MTDTADTSFDPLVEDHAALAANPEPTPPDWETTATAEQPVGPFHPEWSIQGDGGVATGEPMSETRARHLLRTAPLGARLVRRYVTDWETVEQRPTTPPGRPVLDGPGSEEGGPTDG